MKIDKGCPGERLKTSQVADKGPLGGCALPSGNVTLVRVVKVHVKLLEAHRPRHSPIASRARPKCIRDRA